MACGQQGRASQEALNTAIAQWRSSAPATYTIEYERLCLCANSGRFVATVTGTTVVSVDPPKGFGGDDELPFAFTVERVFATLQSAIDRDADRIEVEYDPQLGYPARVSIDVDRSAEDDELVLTVAVTEGTPP